ncbi:MAG: high-affinity branched-chain amino acid ABC transporter permease LivM, partial [Rhodospirillales bacterium]
VVTRRSRGAAAEVSDLGAMVNRLAIYIGPAFIAAALAVPFYAYAIDDKRLVDLGILIFTYIMLGWGLNVVVGLAGLLDLGYVAFYAVGAYSYAIISINLGLNFWETLPIAGAMAATFGILLGFPVLRLRGDYLAIVTLGFGEIIRIILLNWNELSNGPKGIDNIPRPSFFGMQFGSAAPKGTVSFHEFFNIDFSPMHRQIYLYYIIMVLALLTNWFTLRIRKLPIGRAWEALREDETACRALGINPTNTKLTAFAIGAMYGVFAGSFLATRQGFISPESFNFLESAIILSIVVLGGMGSQIGVVVASIVLIGGPEWFRDLEAYHMLAFGGLMVAIMIWRPQGLLAHREPTISLKPPAGGKAR